MKKTKLKPRSDKKAADMLLYAAEKLHRGGVPWGYECHHPIGRIGDKLLCFAIIPAKTHAFIHANGKWAREEGWLCHTEGGEDCLPVGVPYPVSFALERWREITGKTIPRKG